MSAIRLTGIWLLAAAAVTSVINWGVTALIVIATIVGICALICMIEVAFEGRWRRRNALQFLIFSACVLTIVIAANHVPKDPPPPPVPCGCSLHRATRSNQP